MSGISFDFDCSSIIITDQVTVHNTLYKVKDVILIDHKLKLCGKIEKIIVHNCKSNVYFLYYGIPSVLDEHLMAYKLKEKSNNLGVILQSNLYFHKTFTPTQYNTNSYIICEY